MSRTFEIALDRSFKDLMHDELLKIKKVVSLEALKRVTQKMPVDTGRARMNTFVSLGSVGDKTTDETDKTGAAAINRGANTIFADNNPFGKVFVYNNLPYVNRLENGYSKQAPMGMFELTAKELEVMFK